MIPANPNQLDAFAERNPSDAVRLAYNRLTPERLDACHAGDVYAFWTAQRMEP